MDGMEDSTFKVVFAGHQGAGKTTLLCRFAEGTFQDNIPEFETKKRVMNVNGCDIAIVFFDTAGQERFRTLTSGYYSNSSGAIIVFDVSDEESYKEADNWVRDVKRYSSRDATLMLVGNKTDLGPPKVDLTEAQTFAEANHCKFFTVSAKDGTNIDDALNTLVEDILAKKKTDAPEEKTPAPEKEKSGCCTIM